MSQKSNPVVKIAIISDLHVMAPSLLVNDGSALEEYLNRDRKMLRESPEILNTLVEEILSLKPHLVLVTGDLTKDGERVSHELVASQLQRLVDAGIQVLVVPGNHDINNPDAKVYDGDSATPADTITRREFAAIYNTFVSRGDAVDHCKTSGMLDARTQQWLVEQATRAKSSGRHVIAMMHHHLVPHFHMEDTLAAPYMVDEAGQMCRRLIDAGVHVVFTGHLHVSDICQTSYRQQTMVEIATAAAVGYPCQWRVATCNTASGKMQLYTRTLFSLPSQPDFGERSRQVFTDSIPTITRGVLNRYWSEISQAIDNYRQQHPFVMRYVNLPATPDAIADLLLKYLREPVTQAYLSFAEGNESGNDHRALIDRLIKGVDHVVDETVRGILKPFAKAALHLRIYHIARLVLRSILEDRNDIGTKHEAVINDHTAIIEL